MAKTLANFSIAVQARMAQATDEALAEAAGLVFDESTLEAESEDFRRGWVAATAACTLALVRMRRERWNAARFKIVQTS